MKTELHAWTVSVLGSVVVLGIGVAIFIPMVNDYRPVAATVLPTPAKNPAANVAHGAPHQPPTEILESKSGITAVYHCDAGGHPVYSQTPCGVTSEIQEIHSERLNTYHDRQTLLPVARAEPAGSAFTAEITGNANDSTAEECSALEREIKQIEARMRRPYSVPEGNYFRAQIHENYDRTFVLHCGQ